MKIVLYVETTMFDNKLDVCKEILDKLADLVLKDGNRKGSRSVILVSADFHEDEDE